MTGSEARDPLTRIAAMMNMELYAILTRPAREGVDLRPVLNDHLDYMVELEKDGRVFASGPLSGEDGRPTGHGLTIVRGASLKEAAEIAERDPFVQAGLRAFDIHRWTVNEGQVWLGVTFSDRGGQTR
ncbi:hypothetical protein HJA87_21275 [Rhizobium bangladeshense]|uniref:YCII-related domain-containing protein n=1 Tax=Rhizobium bangladeshense TaxID=1138189 RepID=A0ABS7LLL7_9HYPH|nr:YciI family protein [Rhizobium bangladeshense]MBY3592387.1 hypothetical protein [Rhizobium bangladeshense]